MPSGHKRRSGRPSAWQFAAFAVVVVALLAFATLGWRKQRSDARATERFDATVTFPADTAPAPAATDPPPLQACFVADYESGHLLQTFDPKKGTYVGDWPTMQAKPGDISIVNSPVKHGKHAAEFTIRPNQIVSKGNRAEMEDDQDRISAGSSTWMSWSVYFPTGRFLIDPGVDEVFTQWHDGPPYVGMPPFLAEVANRDGTYWLHLSLRGGDDRNPTVKEWYVEPIQFDRWIDLKMHWVWGATPGTGFYQAWLDGKLVAEAHTPTLYSGKYVYLKQGNYRHPSSLTSTLYEDNTVVSDSAAGLTSCTH